MPAPVLAQLLITFGPKAIDLIKQLAAVWSKPSLSVEEVIKYCDLAKKTYDEYIADAK